MRNLRWATFQTQGPEIARGRRRRERNLKAHLKKGLQYERAFGKFLSRKLTSPEGGANLIHSLSLKSHPWILYSDEGGTQYAQPDYILETPLISILFECKLSQTPSAEFQLRELYGPLLEFLYPQRGIIKVQVCKNLFNGAEGLVRSLEEVLELGDPSKLYLWHWIK